MEACEDLEISIGSFVRYVRTGTRGKVIDIKNFNGKTWAKLDTNGLYYDVKFLEVVDRGEKGKEFEKEEEKEKEIVEEEFKIKEEDLSFTGDLCGAG